MESDDQFLHPGNRRADAEQLAAETAGSAEKAGDQVEQAVCSGDRAPYTSDAADAYQAHFAQKVESEAVKFVRSFFKAKGIQILFDETMRYLPAPKPPEVDQLEWDLRPEPDEAWAFAEITDVSATSGTVNFTAAELRRALRRVVKDQSQLRKAQIVALLETSLDEAQKARAVDGWRRLEGLFETKGALCATALMHLVWLTKRKMRGLPVTDHLMPIVFGSTQGSGKTTFVEKFVAPLDDLVAYGVRLADLADVRSGEIFRFAIAVVDDVDPLDQRACGTFKSVVTGTSLARRRLGTSRNVKYAQQTTFIGTANKPVAELIDDSTGHRRFVDLPFRNGNVARGGDPTVWPIVEQMDALLLWQSIDANEASPLTPLLTELAAWQEQNRPRGEVERWLEDLDTSAEEMKAITMKPGVMAERLWLLFKEQADSDLNKSRWGKEMQTHFENPRLPFARKVKTSSGWFYVLKAK